MVKPSVRQVETCEVEPCGRTSKVGTNKGVVVVVGDRALLQPSE